MIACAGALLLAAAPAWAASGPDATGGPACALTASSSAPRTATAGAPCWTDVTPYPFGADGNPVDPGSGECGTLHAPGPGFSGDFTEPCYLVVTSMAFRAWNRGLAATQSSNGSGSPYGVWLYNGTRWYPDPAFPGSAACPGSQVLWAGKLDYWLIGSSAAPEQTLCHFDGVGFQWEELTAPAATLARWASDPQVTEGITAGACYAWDNCWFFGTDGAIVHWDGSLLTDSPAGVGSVDALDGDFTGAVARTSPTGATFGFAITGSGRGDSSALSDALAPLPDGSPPPQLYGSTGGPFAPLGYSPPALAQPRDPFTTDLAAIDYDASGSGWVAGNASPREFATSPRPAPLQSLTATGTLAACPGYGPDAFTYSPTAPAPDGSFTWTSLSVFPSDGSALAGAKVKPATFGSDPNDVESGEPALVHATCGQAPSVTSFRIPDPTDTDQATAPLIAADPGGSITSVSASADNDAWASSSTGILPASFAPLRPHLYQWTDGQTPDATAGDDDEARPSLFTLDPPVYVQTPATVVAPTVVRTTTKRKKAKKVVLKAAIYAVRSKLVHHGSYKLEITFKVRRRLRIGVEALRGRTVVAASPMRTFTGSTGELTLNLDPKRWPNGLRFVMPKQRSHASHA